MLIIFFILGTIGLALASLRWGVESRENFNEKCNISCDVR
jgi:hypothetical protein